MKLIGVGEAKRNPKLDPAELAAWIVQILAHSAKGRDPGRKTSALRTWTRLDTIRLAPHVAWADVDAFGEQFAQIPEPLPSAARKCHG